MSGERKTRQALGKLLAGLYPMEELQNEVTISCYAFEAVVAAGAGIVGAPDAPPPIPPRGPP